MKSVGTVASAALRRMGNREPSPGTQCSLPSLPAKRDADGLSVAFDRECDLEMPRCLFSAWIPDAGQREIVRALTAGERAKLDTRAVALEQALTPYLPDEGHRVSAEIAAMFGGFRAMRQLGEDIAATVEITRRVLRQFPLWAIAKGCMLIAQGCCGLDRRYAPNDAEIYEVMAEIVRPYREALQRVLALLSAPVEEPKPSSPTYAATGVAKRLPESAK
jgi:hypothetical protein